MTQKDFILKKLQENKKVSTVLAMANGIKQLPYVIWKLRQEGYDIQTTYQRDHTLGRNYVVYELY